MAQFPAFPLFTDAYLADTTHLTTLEHGAYLLLLMAMWRTPDKRLPNDFKQLARYAKLTNAQWHRIEHTLGQFFDVDGDFITQGRLTDEASFVRQHSKLQSDKAKARWLKYKDNVHAAAMPEACPPPHPHPHPQVSKIQQCVNGNGLGGRKGKPRQARQSKRLGRVWFDRGTEEFNAYAADYFEKRGVPVTIEHEDEGGGAWFNVGGELDA